MWNRLCVRFASAACDCDRGSARVLLPFWLDARPTTGPRARAGGSYNAISALLEHLDISTRSVLVVVVVGP